jgi:hypothetical protein
VLDAVLTISLQKRKIATESSEEDLSLLGASIPVSSLFSATVWVINIRTSLVKEQA